VRRLEASEVENRCAYEETLNMKDEHSSDAVRVALLVSGWLGRGYAMSGPTRWFFQQHHVTYQAAAKNEAARFNSLARIIGGVLLMYDRRSKFKGTGSA
jgi:hypothetical protein